MKNRLSLALSVLAIFSLTLMHFSIDVEARRSWECSKTCGCGTEIGAFGHRTAGQCGSGTDNCHVVGECSSHVDGCGWSDNYNDSCYTHKECRYESCAGGGEPI
jgi:hypothetical protein